MIVKKNQILMCGIKFWKGNENLRSVSAHGIGSVCTFHELKSPKCKQPLNISENGFLQTGLRISSLIKIFKPDIWASKSLVPTVHLGTVLLAQSTEFLLTRGKKYFQTRGL